MARARLSVRPHRKPPPAPAAPGAAAPAPAGTAGPPAAPPVTAVGRYRAALAVLAPAALLGGLLYHPYVGDLRDQQDVAAAMSDVPRWGASHLVVGVASGLVLLAFLAVRQHLRLAGENRWSAVGIPFVVLGTTLFVFLPAMEIALLAAGDAGADLVAAQTELDVWFTPLLLSAAGLFAVGMLAFAGAVLRAHVVSRRVAGVVALALVVAAAARFVPFLVALWASGAALLVGLGLLVPALLRPPPPARGTAAGVPVPEQR